MSTQHHQHDPRRERPGHPFTHEESHTMSTTTARTVPTVAEALPVLRRVVERQSAETIPGGPLVDLFTASAVVAVYDALGETQRARMADMSVDRAAGIAFKLTSR